MAPGRLVRTLATVSAALVVLSACGSASLNSGIDGAGSVGVNGAGESCDSAAVAAVLAPGSTFDYNPSESPADLASSADVVFRSGLMTLVEVGEDWSTVFVDDVEILVDSRRDRTPITRFGAFGAGVGDRPNAPASAFDGLEMVVFAHMSDSAPGNLVPAIEGFWLQCGDGEPLSVVANPIGEAWNQALGSLDGIVAATAGELAVRDVVVRVDRGDGWRLVDIERGYGYPHEVAIMTSERGLDRAADAQWFDTRPSAAFVFVIERRSLPDTFSLSVAGDVICGGCEHAQIDVDLSAEVALESALWGGGALDVVIDGTPPGDGTANVFRWAPEAALMLPAWAFNDLPSWIQGFGADEARTIEGFVIECGAGGCPEECDDQSCQNLEPLGNICSYSHEPEAFVDRTVTITWNGIDCEISAAAGRANR